MPDDGKRLRQTNETSKCLDFVTPARGDERAVRRSIVTGYYQAGCLSSFIPEA